MIELGVGNVISRLPTPVIAESTRLLIATSVALHLALLARMWRLGLRPQFTFFFYYLSVETFVLGASFLFTPRSNYYAYVYLVGEPIRWLFSILVLLELYGLVLAKYAGVATLSRKVLLVSLGIAIGISFLTLSADLQFARHRYPVLLYYIVVRRGLTFSLLLFQILITGFLLWFPVPLERNVIRHSLVYFCSFLISSMADFYHNITGSSVTPEVNIVLMGASCVCLAGWFWAFSSPGEIRQPTFRPKLAPEEEERLLAQLSAINDAILRGPRK
jgi:hypothetical protein